MNLGGAMFWAMDLDDFSGKKCGEGKFPLINTAKDIVGEKESSTRPSTTRTTPTATATRTSPTTTATRTTPTTTATRTTPTTTAKPTDQSNTAAFYCLNCKYRNIIGILTFRRYFSFRTSNVVVRSEHPFFFKKS